MRNSKPPSPRELTVVQAVAQIERWKNVPRKLVSLEVDEYMRKFRFIPIAHTVHDQSGNPLYILLDKHQAIELLKEVHGLYEKE